MNFGVTGEAAPNAASSRVARYSCAARVAVSYDLLGLPLAAWKRALLVRVGGDKACVDRKYIGAQPLCNAALNDALEHMTQQISLRRSQPNGTVKANKYRPFSAPNPAERVGDS